MPRKRVKAPLFIAFALALSGSGEASRKAWTPAASDLLFSSNRDGDAEIFVRRAGGAEWTNLTRHEGGDNWPVWSADGRRIAFQSRRTGNLDVWTMAADGSGLRQLTHDTEPDYLPAWSPDGSSIVFTSWRRDSSDTSRAPRLHVMRADGSQQQRLAIPALGTSAGATWSPDGKRLVYSRRLTGDGADLFVADRDGSNERRLTHDGDGGVTMGTPAFSPDGRHIACYAADSTGSSLVVMKADGSARRTVVAEGSNWYPRWSPDGRWLVFTAAAPEGDGKDIDVFGVPVTGGSPVRLASSPLRESEGSWRPAVRPR